MANGISIVDYIEAGARAAGLKQQTIAQNVANSSTPGYRRSDVEFHKYFAEALASGGEIDLSQIVPKVNQPKNTPINSDGSDVNMDMEVGEMIKNSTQYKMYMRLMAKMYQQMEMAIQDRVL